MTGFEQTKNILRVAGVLLLLMMVMGASMAAQSLNPVPCPTPAAVPPPVARSRPIRPDRQAFFSRADPVGIVG